MKRDMMFYIEYDQFVPGMFGVLIGVLLPIALYSMGDFAILLAVVILLIIPAIMATAAIIAALCLKLPGDMFNMGGGSAAEEYSPEMFIYAPDIGEHLLNVCCSYTDDDSGPTRIRTYSVGQGLRELVANSQRRIRGA